MFVGSDPIAVTKTSDIALVSSKEFFDIEAAIECKFTMKRVRDMIILYRQMHRTDKYSKHSSIIQASFSPWDWAQIGIKLGIKHGIYQKLANFM